MSNAYDTRVREIIARTGNANLFPELDIPRRTRATWVRCGPREVVGLGEELVEQARQLERIAKLEHRVRVLTVLLRLVLAMLRLSGFRVHMPRIPEGKDRQALLFAVAKARALLPLASVLKLLHLSASRYHAWLRVEQECELDDRSSCPRAMPQRLTGAEVRDRPESVCARPGFAPAAPARAARDAARFAIAAGKSAGSGAKTPAV